MIEETSAPAATQAAEHTQPAASPADHHQEHYQEQPAEETPEQYEEHYQDEPAEEPADLGLILEEAKPKKLSGAQRAKLQRQYLENELAARDQRIAELERHFADQDERRRSDEAEQRAEAQRKRDEAHNERIRGAKDTIADFDAVMATMRGKTIHEDLLGDVMSSEKSALLAYHLAKNPDQLEKLNHMSDRERAREIGRLEGTLKMPEGKRQTSAPPPPTKLTGGAAPHADERTGPHDMHAYADWWKRREAEKRRGR